MRGDLREAAGGDARLSRPSAGRLSLYLRRLEGLLREGAAKVSSGQLGEALGVSDAQVRKDLASLGALGHPGVGYQTEELIAGIRRVLGLNRRWAVALVGVGNLARALLRYRGFQEQGFQIVALFDADVSKVGQRVDGLRVHSPDDMPEVIAKTKAELGLLTVPSEAAQSVADALVAAGVRGILNFAPVVLRLPSRVRLVSVDLAVQLEQLAFLVQMSAAEAR
jgi:redox-sensing transcriptional repressor